MYVVTEGAGFVGLNLVTELAGRGDEVVVCDWMRAGKCGRNRNLAKHKIEEMEPESLQGWPKKNPKNVAAVLDVDAISATTETGDDLVANNNISATLNLISHISR